MAELLKNAKLTKNDSAKTKADGSVLEGKVVGLYFSAHWCPPCRNFTPILKDFHAELEDDGGFEIVYVPFDRTQKEITDYLAEAHGEWYYLTLEDPLIKELAGKYDVSGIPALIIIKPNGDVITKEGRTDVQGKAPPAALAGWKKA